MSTQAVLDAVTKLQENQNALSERLETLAKPNPENRSAPWARKGEDPLTSRGYSYLKCFGLMAGHGDPNYCKTEKDISDKLRKLYDSFGYRKALTNSVMVPFASQFLVGDEPLAREVGEVVRAGITGYDREEVLRLRNMHWGVNKALSWQDETQGGALVGPPLMGELIELLRNNEVLMTAGARVMAMPPNGRITFPRQTGSGTAYWVGESTALTESNPTTGDVVLQGKKLGILTKIPNELFRFASVSAEMFLREDMVRVLALKLDKTLLEDVGSATTPKGLINYAGITAHTAQTVGANGNTFQPEDVLQMVAKVEEQNAVFRGFIMRPLLYAAIANRRSDAVAAGDSKGPFVFNMFRELNAMIDVTRMTPGNLNGYVVNKSTQIANTRSKGSASNLSYILGGDFSDYMIALSGAMEFQISTQGDTPFTQDQTWFRGLTFCDGAPRHEGSFALCDSLVVN